MDDSHFVTNDGRKVFFKDISVAIEKFHPTLINEHIFKQLHALGLWADFIDGSTPSALPYTFSGSEKW